MGNYVPLHLHTMLSNATTTLDSVNSYQQYINKALEYNINAICFTEHGNIMGWYNKMLECKKNNIKYIHGCEVYITKNINEKIRDNYHCILISRNTEGLKELNKLLSHNIAFNKKDGHFYYNPRITYKELKSTSNNIIILTACLGGILNSSDIDLRDDFIKFLSINKDRCFLEIQPHIDIKGEQAKYNDFLISLSKKYDIKLVATNDVHYIDNEYKKGRSLLQKRKNIHFENEEGWDLEFKDYNGMIKAFEKQNTVEEEVYKKALKNTNLVSEMISDYEVDVSIKYPKLYNNSEEVFIKKIKEGIKTRNIDMNIYRDRINYEFKVIKNGGSIDYFLLEEDIKSWCRSNGVKYGASRGSVSGSIIAYILGVTDVDSVKYNLNFERFLSPERVSLCDVDTDVEPSKRELVKKYLYKKEGLYCSEIITFNTIKEKGALKDVGGALGYDFDLMNEITKNIDDEIQRNEYQLKYPELFKYAKMLEGVVVSVGIHPAATVVSPYPLDSSIGTFTNNNSDFPITQINMKEVDKMNFVKLDILGLETIEIINKVCKMAGIDFLTPQNFDIEDENIYKEIHKSGVGIFQWESDTAWEYYKKLFSEETIDKIKQKNKDFKYLDLLSIGNGAIRPAGESYRDKLSQGVYKDNGVEVVNEYFKSTLSNCVFQEQIMGFLNKFCGFSMGEADTVRRGFAKKTGTEHFIPKIKEGFLKNSGLSQEEGSLAIETFIKVVEDASDYLFSLNHSQVYSIIGCMCAYLRYYHTLEFITVSLEHSKNDKEKTSNFIKFMNDFTNYKLMPISFGKSNSEYSCDKESGIIYKGMSSVKYVNEKIPEELNELYKKNLTFPQLVMELKETSVNSRQLNVLIKVDYFKQYGSIGKLITFVEYIEKLKNKTFKKSNIDSKLEYFIKDYSILNVGKNGIETYKDLDKDKIFEKIWNELEYEEISDIENIRNQIEYLGYLEEVPNNLSVAKVEMVSIKNRSCNLKSFRNNETRWFRFNKNEVTLPKKDDIIVIYDIYKKEGYKGRIDYYVKRYEKI